MTFEEDRSNNGPLFSVRNGEDKDDDTRVRNA